MKKGEEYLGVVEEVNFPNKGFILIEDKKVMVKGVIRGQMVRFVLRKNRSDKAEGRLLEVIKKSEMETAVPDCVHFGACGGCTYQTIPYSAQLKIKEEQVKRLLNHVLTDECCFEGIQGSPCEWSYRNKMEFSFGDAYKDGPLVLGLHKKGSMYDIVPITGCKIVHEDFNKVLTCVLGICSDYSLTYFHKLTHMGYLRHLLIRRAQKTGEIIIALVTTSQFVKKHDVLSESKIDENLFNENEFTESTFLSCLVYRLSLLDLNGKISGILHIVNDNVADVVKCDRMDVLYGKDYIYEEILGLKFKISVFSFFQTNSLGAEVLYNTVREFAGNNKYKTVFDLFCGTGTIAQVMSPLAIKVIGVEIVGEAVAAARQNAEINGLSNCEFIEGDVLKVIDIIEDKPDFIVLDPPREGIHPKALRKIIEYGVNQIVYISCNPISFVRDLEVFKESGYRIERMKGVDMFPMTVHVETVCLMSKVSE